MGIFGLGASKQKKTPAKAGKKTAKKGGQGAEAAAVLKKMKAKKDAGDCAFC